jgi:hypothetical protein
MPKKRYQSPDRIVGAADLSDYPELRGSLNMVKLVKKQGKVWDELREACELEVKYARKRIAGHWELVAVAFVTSGYVDVQPWYDNTPDELWRECGFDKRPSRQTADRRLRELEGVYEKFLAAAGAVIRHCRKQDSRVMAHVHFDFTEDETHAALVHDCKAGESCKRRARSLAGRAWTKRGHPLRPRRAATQEARERRERWNEEDPAESVKSAKSVTPKMMMEWRDGRYIKRVQVNGCWYRTRDVNAGVRAYTSRGKTHRFWHGYYSGKAVDHYTGGVIPSVDPANKQEYDLFIPLYDRVASMVGEAPQTVIGDRGLSVERCFQHAAENGSAPVFPWRRYGDGKRHDKDTHDRHGVMRCKYCGGHMNQVKYSKNNGKPRLWFRCASVTTPDCAREQTITCATDWRYLIPLSRMDPLYHELRKSHRTYEATHDYWRDRYKVAADTLANRPKSIGLDRHRLRASVACFVDWLRIAYINEWIKCVSRRAHDRVRSFRWAARKAARELADKRARAGLNRHYGPQAKALDLGEETPPSRRPPPTGSGGSDTPPGK